jgi:hypothetical protein
MSQSELNIRPGSFLGPEPRPFHLKYLGRLMVSPIGGCSFLRVVTQALTATLDRDSVTGSLDRNSSNGIVLISLVLYVSTIFCEIAANQPGWSSYHGSAVGFCDRSCGIRSSACRLEDQGHLFPHIGT